MSMKCIIKASCVRSYPWTANWKSHCVSIMSQIINAFLHRWTMSHSLFPSLIAVMPTGRSGTTCCAVLDQQIQQTQTYCWALPWVQMSEALNNGLLLPTINVQMCKSGRICWVSWCLGSQWLAEHLPGLKKQAEHMCSWWGMRWMVVGCVCPQDHAIQNPLWCPVASNTAEGPCRAAAISRRESLGLTKVQVASRTLASSELTSAGLLGIWWLNKY